MVARGELVKDVELGDHVGMINFSHFYCQFTIANSPQVSNG